MQCVHAIFLSLACLTLHYFSRQAGRQADRQTDRHEEAEVAFRSFSNSSRNESKIKHNNNKLNQKYGKTDRTLRTALFWVMTHPVVKIYYLRFGKTYRFQLPG